MRHDELDWHMHATEPGSPLAERIRVEAALALIDVIRMNEMGRLRICEADDCEGLVLDLSRNASQAVLHRAVRQPDEHDRLPRAPSGDRRRMRAL